MRIFGDLPHLHGLTKTCRPLMEKTALLHDIEETRVEKDHAERGAARIRTLRTPTVPRDWLPLISQAVRLHSVKSDLGPLLRRLRERPTAELELAGRLGAILRIGDGLDHERRQDTEIAAIIDDGREVEILLSPSPSARANAAFAMRKADLWNQLTLRPIRSIEVAEGETPQESLVNSRQPAAEAARRILQRHWEQFASRTYGVTNRRDPEYVHEMRVAIRRFRSAADVFRDCLEGGLKQWKREVSTLAERLGAIRDADVFIESLRKRLADAPRSHRAILLKIIQSREAISEAGRRELRTVLGGSEYRDIQPWLARLAALGEPGGRRLGKRRAGPMWREARRSLRRYLGDVYKYGRNLRKLPPLQQHALRIDVKRLRYLAESVQDFYGPGFEDAIGQMSQLQDLLGEVHDSYVYADWLGEESRRIGKKSDAAIRGLVEYLEVNRGRCLKRATRIWKEFRGRKSRKRLLKMIDWPRET
jgi:CHAD domain-containing protein